MIVYYYIWLLFSDRSVSDGNDSARNGALKEALFKTVSGATQDSIPDRVFFFVAHP